MDKDSSDVKHLSGLYNQLKQEMDVLKADFVHLKSWLIKNKCYDATDNHETVDEKVDITTEVAKLEEIISNLTLETSQKDNDIQHWRKSFENARDKIKDLEMNLANVRDKIQDFESILEKKNEEIKSLTADLVSKDRKLSRALEHIAEIENEKVELQAKLQELETVKSDYGSNYGNYTDFVRHGHEQNGIFYSDGEDAVEETEVNNVGIDVNTSKCDLNKVQDIEEVEEVGSDEVQIEVNAGKLQESESFNGVNGNLEIINNNQLKTEDEMSLNVQQNHVEKKSAKGGVQYSEHFEDIELLKEREKGNNLHELINESYDSSLIECLLEPEIVIVEDDYQEVNVTGIVEEEIYDEKEKEKTAKRFKGDYSLSDLPEFEPSKQYEEPVIPGLKHLVSGACRLGLWNPCIQFLEDKLQPYSSAYKQFLTIKNQHNFLTMAAEQGLDDLVAILLANGMSPNQTVDRLGTVLLHTAVKGYHKPLVLLLLKKGASTEKRDRSKKTPLHYAAEYGYYDISKILVDNDANINVKDECGKTPLHHATSSATEKLVELFLGDNRCDTDVIDVFGHNAFDYTYQKAHIMKIFKKYLLK